VFQLLSFFGDGKEHTYTETFVGLVTLLGKNAIPYLRRALEYGWLKRSFKSGVFADDKFSLSSRGDEYLRALAVRYRESDYWKRFYKYFDRTKDGFERYAV